MLRKSKKSEAADVEDRQGRRFTMDTSGSIDDCKHNDESRKDKKSRPSPSSEDKKKKKQKNEKIENSAAEEIFVGRSTTKKDKKKKETPVPLTDEQILEYAAKAKIREIFTYLFFLIATTVVVLYATSDSAGHLARAVTKEFMETPFTNLVAEKVLPGLYEPHQVGVDIAEAVPSKPKPANVPMSTTKAPSTPKPTSRTAVLGEFQRRSRGINADDDSNEPEPPIEESSDPKTDDDIKTRSSKADDEAKRSDEGMTPEGYDWRGFLADAKMFLTPRNLKRTTSLEDLWNFMETSFLNVLYADNWYSNEDPINETLGEERQVLFTNQLIGIPRLRQVKVRTDSCTINPTLQHYFNSCMAEFSDGVEDLSPITPKHTIKLTIPAWMHSPATETKAWWSYGDFASYGPAGFYIDLPRDKAEAKAIIQELKDNEWVTRATRAVILDFTLYNANVNLFLVCKIIFEMPPTGGVHPKVLFEPMKFYRYVSTTDFIVMGGEIFLILFIFYLTFYSVRRISPKGLQSLTQVSVILTIAVIGLGWSSIIMGIHRYVVIEPEVTDLVRRNYNSHPSFGWVTANQKDFNHVTAVLLFFVWLRGVLYLKYCEWILPIFRAIGDRENRNALVGLTVLFLALVFALAQLGYLIFGEQSEQFQTIGRSLATVFVANSGHFDYLEIERISVVAAGLFFIIYTFLIFFIILMLFAAVISHAYTMARTTIAPIKDRMAASYLTYVLSFGRKGKETDEDRSISHVRKVLSRGGYTDLEIDMFFKKFGVDPDKKMTVHQKNDLINALRKRKFEYDNVSVSPHDVAFMMDEISRLKDKVSELSRQAEKSRRQLESIA